jgi:hypothetical protein
MLYVINEEFVNFTSEEVKNIHGEFTKTNVNTSTEIFNELDGVNVNNPFTLLKWISERDIPVTDTNMHISITEVETGKNNVLLRSTKDVQRDKDIFILAFPFNGIVKPIPEIKEIRILKGIIVSSNSYSVKWEEKRYRKILYLVFQINPNILNNVGFKMNLESYQLLKNKTSKKIESTIIEKFFLDISPNKEIEISLDEKIYQEDLSEQFAKYKNEKLLNIFSLKCEEELKLERLKSKMNTRNNFSNNNSSFNNKNY